MKLTSHYFAKHYGVQVPEAGDGTSLPSTGTHRQLEQRAPDAIIPVMDYAYSTWISNSIFKVHQWSMFISSVRTNNDVEGNPTHNNCTRASKERV
jgi:hypothetical protein